MHVLGAEKLWQGQNRFKEVCTYLKSYKPFEIDLKSLFLISEHRNINKLIGNWWQGTLCFSNSSKKFSVFFSGARIVDQ